MSALLEVEELRVCFGGTAAVDGLSFGAEPGELLALVGESGSGKSLAALSLLGMVPPPGRVAARRLAFAGADLAGLEERAWRRLRGREIALVAQDPLGALNPMLPIGLQVAEVLEVHEGLPRAEALARAERALAEVELPEPAERLRSYPHELSGGQRQRVAIAMALVARPRLLVADEPTTALDVTVQARILALLDARRRADGTAVLLITHSLGVVAQVAERVLVCYAGRLAEEAPVEALFAEPLHPYTRALLACVPRLSRPGLVAPIAGRPPDPAARPAGCAFHPRCPLAAERCRRETPRLFAPAPGRRVACHAVEGAP